MSPGVLLQHMRNQLDSLSQLLEQTRIEGPYPLDAEDYRDLAALVLKFPEDYRLALDSELRRVYAEQSQDLEQLQQRRAELMQLVDRSVDMVSIVEQDPAFRKLATQYSFLQPLPSKLTEAVAWLKREQMRLSTEWPVCSPEEQARIEAEASTGQIQPIDHAFARMKGISLDELHRRLEEHKARRKEYGWE